MASASIPPNDDNDEFDWEAAVIEIDSACQVASTSTPNPHDPSVSIPKACPIPAKINDKVRQSTLERFVDSFTKRKKGNKGLLESHIREKNVPLDPGRDGDLGGNDASPAVKIDLEAAKTWIYPVNVPLREYQFSIARTALFSNTLVALPTGLGKTLIAAVVMYNYFRWFPEGKIVFAAPSRPLVMQQIEACHNIVGIPQEWAIDMTGQMSPSKRSSCWKSRRVFFVTPQVLEKDIQSGIFSVKELVCLVIDEAHRALGNYSYCVAVRELLAVPVQLRILALTATPGSKQRAIQNVIDNLCISTLEYRNEDDKDVSPHVHNRKLELIQVSMGKDAIAIDNLLLEVIRPYVARLFAIGVLYSRDCATLSPCELLISRDKFRQTPPLNLPHAKYGEVEGCFGALITLYHIKKLLSSHGIRPAYEMLQEKLTQGSFARLMTRNETMSKAKLLMQQSLSHGVPNPKLVKMLEVLVDHFKTKDPRDSRVIIFSNFRGSVKDIMDSLANIDNDLVKATEFIGQSSAKTLKGQSQKVQQAVLQRFRAGGFNVIVATSIGEEGLDIMEVDLVICFDANISPLRMIQRMGRTGRKHDGRVVVLACEGSELKGYLKKQATGKTVRKHMHNGGIKSFDFHASPRMIPHICKPEVQFVELSIEQFIPRGKKVKDGAQDRSPFPKRVSHEEHELIVRYFHSIKEDAWKPSLIAFPSFQAFPCDVHKVQHSFKTIALLIDAVQKLQRLSFSKIERPCLFQAETPNQFLDSVTADKPKQDSPSDNKVPEALLGVESSEVEALSTENPESKVGLYLPDDTTQNYPIPVLPLKMSAIPKTTSESQKGSQGNPGNNATPYRATEVQNGMPTIELEQVVELASASKKCVDCEGNLTEHSAEYAKHDEQDNDKFVLETPVSKAIFMYSKDSEERSGKIILDSLGGGLRKTLRDTELSPRLTYYIEEGVVPESPMTKVSQFPYKVESTEEGFVPESPMEKVSQSVVHMESSPGLDSAKLHKKDTQTDVALQLDISISSSKKNEALANISASLPMKNVSGKSGMHHMQDSVRETENKMGMLVLVSPDEKVHTPLADPRINSSSEDWRLSSGGASGSIQQAPKYRRLCKYGDQITRGFRKSLKDKCGQILEKGHGNTNRTLLNPMEYDRGKKKARKCINTFIEEEAEVSEDAEISADEEEDENENEYEDSFIDDRINPTEACSEAENAGDVMAFYRRSLLTQSPVETLPRCPDPSYDSVSSRRTESGSCSSENLFSSIQTPQHGLPSVDHSVDRNSLTRKLNSQGVSLMNKLGGPSDIHTQIEFSTKLESRKRKLSFQLPASIPSTDFQLPLQCPPENTETDNNLLGDDDFYQSLDLDAVETQATELLRNRSGLSVEKMPQMILDKSMGLKEDCSVNCLGNPSFNLGI